jgi:subtilisin family serine protease
MTRHARRDPSALLLEVLEPRALLSGDPPQALAPVPPGPASSLLVRFVPGTPAATIQADLAAAGTHLVKSFPDGGSLVALDQGVGGDAAQQRLRQDLEVVYIEPDGTFQAQVQAKSLIPDDPAFGLQWGLNDAGNVGIDAPQAWNRTAGSSSIIVAVLDTGIDLSNPEFAGRIWTNPNPSSSDGYPGDVHGWNFVSNDANVQDDDGHGTHVSGIIAASGNNGIGVAGVDWNAQIMPLKVLDSNGSGSNDAMVAAIDFVTAAGNDGTNNDSTPFYPASYRLSNEIAVAAVDPSGDLPGFSDYGARTVDLAAPGLNILSTIPGGGYAYMSGTSMAAPYVSGVVSLVAGLHPSWNARQLVQQVLSTAKPLPGLAGKTVTGGIVDAARAVGVSHPGTNGAGGSQLARLSVKTPSIRNVRAANLLNLGRHHRAARPAIGPAARTSSLQLTGTSWPRRRADLHVRPVHPGASQFAPAWAAEASRAHAVAPNSWV